MKILHTISSMGINGGGPTTCTYYLLTGIIQKGNEVKVLTFEPEAGDRLISNELFIETVPAPNETRYSYSKPFKNALNQNLTVDVIHANGLWQYTSYISGVIARKNSIPFILTPHGMLYPSALKKSKWIKIISLFLYQRKALEKATILHATCMQEMQHIRALGIKTPVAVIPNPVTFNPRYLKALSPNKKVRVGFMGRFQPIKNIENLIEAWAKVEPQFENVELVLIGDGEPVYKASIENLAQKLNVKNIVFTGFITGEKQLKEVDSLSFLVLPSKSENFGMVVPEALLREIPVIASKGTPWEELNTHNCGWWVEMGAEPLRVALEEALSLPEAKRLEMGKNGRKLVEEKYSVEAVSVQMLELYNWILFKESKPTFIY